jgi:hypothetical protein
MGDPYRALEDGYASLIDGPPSVLALGERGASAWVIGYLYALTQRPCPTGLQVTYDATLGHVYEVTEGDDRKVGYTVHMHKARFIPTRLYER